MANGDLLPSPSETDPRDLIIQLARKAAHNVQCPLADVLRRPKSQTYLFGQVSKAFPLMGGGEIRQLIASIRWEHLDDPSAHKVEAPKQTRRPVKGREPISSEAWVERAEALRPLITVPLTHLELQEVAQRELGYSPAVFVSVIAAAEQFGVLEYHPPYWMPTPKERRVPKDKRVVVSGRTKRELPCPLTDGEKAQAMERAAALVIQRDSLKTELARIRREFGEVVQQLESCHLQVRWGTIEREVECEERLDLETSTVITVRLDTLDIVERRAMTSADRQLELEQ